MPVPAAARQAPGVSAAELVRRAFAAADNAAHRPGADPSDLTAQAAELQFDSARIFAFVRDQTRIEPYRGSLRGARGVLAGRAGNSLDRSLLLQALLTESGVQCRLMQGVLPPAAARRALQHFLSVPALDPSTLGRRGPAQQTEQRLEQAGIPVGVVQEIADRAAVHSEAFWQSTFDQSSDRTAFVVQSIHDTGLKPASAHAVQQDLLAALSTHYWVQRQDAAGQWIDLDPMFPDLNPGQTAGQEGNPIDAVPTAARHQMDVSLVYRIRVDGAIKDQILLTHTVDAADALFNPMSLTIQSAESNLPNPAGLDGKGRIALIQRMKKFQGVFRCGDEMVAGRPFDLEGNTYEVQPGGVLGNAIGVGQGVGQNFGGLGGALGGGGTADEKKPPQLIEVRVVLTLRSPDRPPITQTRIVVDGQKPAPPLLNWELFLEPQFMSASLADYQAVSYLARQRPAMEAMLTPGHGWPAADPYPYPLNATPLALMRNVALRHSMHDLGGVTPFMDHPNLWIVSHRVGIEPNAAGPVGRWGVDLVEMGLKFVPHDVADESAAFAAAVRQGVTESTVEEAFLASAFPGRGVDSAAGRIDLARIESRTIRAVRPTDAAALKALGWSDSDTLALAAGEPQQHLILATAILPGQTPAWWSVAPDGTTVARSRGGAGDSDVDVAELTVNVIGKVLCILEGYHSMTEKTEEATLDFLECVAFQGAAGGTELAAEGSEIKEGLSWGLSLFDIAVWGIKGMARAE